MTEIARETESGMVGQHTEVRVRNLDLINSEELKVSNQERKS